MRCERCPASREECYAESYECDWYCLAGVQDDDREEFGDGELGCRLHPMTVKKRVRINEEAFLKDKEEQVEWFLKREKADMGGSEE